jgi:methylated-DNA-[protein]-cysteine S-methyltransferase
MNSCVIASPFGHLKIEYTKLALSGLGFVSDPVDTGITSAGIFHKVTDQLNQYCRHANFEFDVPLDLKGTEFQKSVWSVLCKIPAGQVRTYGDIAAELSSSARAVGNACRANPVVLIVPCHRVVAKHGAGGYMGQVSGDKLYIKRQLLRHEGLEI